ncbi:MAG: NUDIX hydrolase [candidate division WOR-3 bacterium]|jgi:ADP-ribose pyrophosphatase
MNKLIYKGRVFEVRSEEVIINNKKLQRDVVYHPGAVAILVKNNDKFLFVKQYRHPTREKLIEIPAGTLELNESPYETAKRELLEEAGIKTDKLIFLIKFFVAPGYCSELIHLFYTDEFEITNNNPEEEEDIEIEWIEINKAYEMIKNNQIKDAKTIIALSYYRNFF